jgi:hypothetical protein
MQQGLYQGQRKTFGRGIETLAARGVNPYVEQGCHVRIDARATRQADGTWSNFGKRFWKFFPNRQKLRESSTQIW